jgi:hypothetical protein
MDHLREDGDEVFEDLLPERFRQLTPEVLGISQHDDSHSLTKDNSSSMAAAVNFARVVERGTEARLVAGTASFSCIESVSVHRAESGGTVHLWDNVARAK